MSTTVLNSLINQAGNMLTKHICSLDGHDWKTEGGRACEKGWGDCGQTVYVCGVCGEYDYGYPGGPGHDDCKNCTLEDLNEEEVLPTSQFEEDKATSVLSIINQLPSYALKLIQ